MTIVALPRQQARPLALAVGWIRALGQGIGAAADGLVVGLVIGFVAATASGAPAGFLGVPDPVAVLGVAAVLLAVAAAAARTALLVRRAVHALTRALRSRPGVAARHPLVTLIGLPDRLLRVLPVPWLAAFAAFLWIAMVGRNELAPLALLTPPASLVPYVYIVGVVGAMLGLARAMARPRSDGRLADAMWRRTGAGVAVMAAGVLVAAVSLAWWPGDASRVPTADPTYDGRAVATPLEDPGAAGPYPVERMTYGSGTDARRPGFGEAADRITTSVDASALLAPLAPGADAARAWFWGFDTHALPIQGLAWLPVGEGPFPLILIAHGNHAMGDFSESGYAYLGEHLASRGFVVASIDEDFLNGSWADDYHGDEQVVRAWLLLLHLDLWRDWSAAGDPLAGRADPERVALIGHSRGGEAASVAAALAHGDTPPRTGMAPWPTGLDVDAVVSIAPSDGQYTGSLRLEGVDFLTLQGGWDADARAWSGIRQYARTTLAPDGFAAGMWVYRANHGQFNTVWGDADFGPFSPAVLDRAPLLTGEEQRDVARTAIGAFLEASLLDREGYRGLFRRPMVGRSWLPDDIVVVRSRTGLDQALTAGVPDRPVDGAQIATTNARADTLPIPLRALQPEQALRGTLLTWSAGDGTASWRIDGFDRVRDGDAPPSALRIALADGRALDESDGVSLPVAIRAMSDGRSVRLPIDRFGALPPPLPVRLAKHDLLAAVAGIDLTVRSESEVVLQTYEIPLSAFAEADPTWDPAGLQAVTVELPRTQSGALWIAEPALVP